MPLLPSLVGHLTHSWMSVSLSAFTYVKLSLAALICSPFAIRDKHVWADHNSGRHACTGLLHPARLPVMFDSSSLLVMLVTVVC